ncbi:hypothetical protein ILYODFUR_005607 [Ilyodon furcidens]|uniref:Uncharacterized protein n=1 Tax=Ilyodon furcidens TaxID=33524 RepID=A0ABV0VEK7_9TELE
MGGHHRRVASQKLLAPSEESRAEPKKAREAERACMHACMKGKQVQQIPPLVTEQALLHGGARVLLQPGNHPVIYVRCVAARRHLKHAGQGALRSRGLCCHKPAHLSITDRSAAARPHCQRNTKINLHFRTASLRGAVAARGLSMIGPGFMVTPQVFNMD